MDGQCEKSDGNPENHGREKITGIKWVMTMMSSLVDWTWLSEYCQRWSIYQQKKLKSIENKDRKEKAITKNCSTLQKV